MSESLITRITQNKSESLITRITQIVQIINIEMKKIEQIEIDLFEYESAESINQRNL